MPSNDYLCVSLAKFNDFCEEEKIFSPLDIMLNCYRMVTILDFMSLWKQIYKELSNNNLYKCQVLNYP